MKTEKKQTYNIVGCGLCYGLVIIKGKSLKNKVCPLCKNLIFSSKETKVYNSTTDRYTSYRIYFKVKRQKLKEVRKKWMKD